MQQSKSTLPGPGMKMPEIISANPFMLLMLEHLEIRLGFNEKTISEVCDEYNIDQDIFRKMVSLYMGNLQQEVPEYSPNVIRTIIMYLRNSHQYYLEDKYPVIRSCIDEINNLNDSPGIQMIGKFFDKYFIEVKQHLDYENSVVFPYVAALDDVLRRNIHGRTGGDYSMNDYREHHDDIEEKLEDLKNLLLRYLPQKNDGKARRKLLLHLSELEYDLRIHSLVEESLLIPLVERMETLSNYRE